MLPIKIRKKVCGYQHLTTLNPSTEKVILCLKSNNNNVFHIKICVIYVVDQQENPKIKEKKIAFYFGKLSGQSCSLYKF